MEMTISVMQMSQCSDDVAIDRVKYIHGDLRDVYADVKNCALTFAREYDLTNGKQSLVEMSENLEGLPSAYIYIEDKIKHMFFATRQGGPNL
jgi:hypothetical protein